MAALLRRTTFTTSIFRCSTPSFMQRLRCFMVQNIEKKVLTTSNFWEELNKPRKERKRQFAEVPNESTCSPTSRQIHVGNLLNISEDSLFEYFSKYGEVAKIDSIRNGSSKLLRNYAFITFGDVKTAQNVLKESHSIEGRSITVGRAYKEKKTHGKIKKDLAVLVKNVSLNIGKEAIKKHFSQYGKVNEVILAEKGQPGESLSSYYVIFTLLSAAKRALIEPTQRIGDEGVESQVMEHPMAKEFTGATNRLILKSVPTDATVDDLKDYFQKFGEVEYVELFLYSSSLAQKNSNVAFVHFANKSTVEDIVASDGHVINGSKVTVSKREIMQTQTNSHQLKLSVEGLPLSAKQLEVKRFFQETFQTLPSFVCFKRDHIVDQGKVICIVQFRKKSELEMVLEKSGIVFAGSPLNFRRLVWSKDTEQQ